MKRPSPALRSFIYTATIPLAMLGGIYLGYVACWLGGL